VGCEIGVNTQADEPVTGRRRFTLLRVLSRRQVTLQVGLARSARVLRHCASTCPEVRRLVARMRPWTTGLCLFTAFM
jgi:hypothetical protein